MATDTITPGTVPLVREGSVPDTYISQQFQEAARENTFTANNTSNYL